MFQNFTSPGNNNNYKAYFEKSPSTDRETMLGLKENNLWNDSFVKVVGNTSVDTSVVLADTTNIEAIDS